jgi:hypothetical protein
MSDPGPRRTGSWNRSDVCGLQSGILQGLPADEIARALNRCPWDVQRKLNEVGDILGCQPHRYLDPSAGLVTGSTKASQQRVFVPYRTGASASKHHRPT